MFLMQSHQSQVKQKTAEVYFSFNESRSHAAG